MRRFLLVLLTAFLSLSVEHCCGQEAATDGATSSADSPDTQIQLLGFARLENGKSIAWTPDGKPAELPLPEKESLSESTIAIVRSNPSTRFQGYLLNGSTMHDFGTIERSTEDPSISWCRLKSAANRRFGNIRFSSSRLSVIETFDMTEKDVGETIAIDRHGIQSLSGLAGVDDDSLQITMTHSNRSQTLAAITTHGRQVFGRVTQRGSRENPRTTMLFQTPLSSLKAFATFTSHRRGFSVNNVALQPGVPATPRIVTASTNRNQTPEDKPPFAKRLQINGITIDVLGVGRLEDDVISWWSADGEQTVQIPEVAQADLDPFGTTIAMRIHGAGSFSAIQRTDNTTKRIRNTAFATPAYIWLAELDATRKMSTGHLRLSLTTNDGATVDRVTIREDGSAVLPDDARIIKRVIGVRATGSGSCEIEIQLQPERGIDFVVETKDGKTVQRTAGSFGQRGATLTFPVTLKEVAAFCVNRRKLVDAVFNDISLQPGQKSSLQMTQAETRPFPDRSANTPRDMPRLQPTTPAQVTITGTVKDKETGNAVPRYKLTPGYVYSRGNQFFDIRKAQEFDTQAFVFELVPPRFSSATKVVQQIRVEASGYPAQIVEVNTATNPVILDIQLDKNAGTHGVVVNAQGKPVPSAKVVACLTSRWTQINDNTVRFSSPNTLALRPDAQGRFVVSDADAAYAVLVLDDTGYALVELSELQKNDQVVLQPFTAVSGRFLVDGKPVNGAVMQLRFEPKSAAAAPNGNVLLQYRTYTDKNGNYAFTDVPAWPASIGRELILRKTQYGQTVTSAPAKHVILQAGQPNTFDFQGGAKVSGKLVAPKTFQGELDFTQAHGNVWLQQDRPDLDGGDRHEREAALYQWIQTDAGRAYWLDSHSSGFKTSADGTFQMTDLPPGEYRLMCRVQEPPADDSPVAPSRELAMYSGRFTVNPDADNLQLGELELTILNN